MMQAALMLHDVGMTYAPTRRLFMRNARDVVALKEVNLEIAEGEIVALVGESGAGKTTLAKLVLGLERPTHGHIYVDGVDLTTLSTEALRQLRHRMHLIFQDPYSSLHPRMRIGEIVAESLKLSGKANDQQTVLDAVSEVDLVPSERFVDRYPHELSGGQRQRVAMARAIVHQPRLIIADEPTSMLDVSLRVGILDLIRRMRERHRVAVLFITHDLAVARYVADRIAVLHQGRLVEVGASSQVIDAPQHTYTQRLIAACEGRLV